MFYGKSSPARFSPWHLTAIKLFYESLMKIITKINPEFSGLYLLKTKINSSQL